MSVIIKSSPRPTTVDTARMKCRCGATVQFIRGDVCGDQRDGDYVVCPACKAWIAESILRWVRRVPT